MIDKIIILTYQSNMEHIIEASKEGLRVIVIAVIPLLIDSLSTGRLDWRLLLVTGIIALLRAIDKWLHESKTAEKGLTRF